MSILVLGTVALDSVRTPHGFKKNILGGSAAHFSMSARLFVPVHLVAVVGEDFPQEHIDFLKRKGVSLTSLTKDKDGKTFRWEGEYKGDLNTALTLNTHLGVLSTFKPQITLEESLIKHIFLANVDPEIQLDLLNKLRSPQLVACDSMNFWINTKKNALLKLMKKVNIFVANDGEARLLSGENNLLSAAEFILNQGPRMAVIKKGEHGVLFVSKDFMLSLPGYPVKKVVDPTGAGDTFAGGFMGYLAKMKKINLKAVAQALAYGSIAASFNIEGFGLDRTKDLTLAEVNQRLKRFKTIISF